MYGSKTRSAQALRLRFEGTGLRDEFITGVLNGWRLLRLAQFDFDLAFGAAFVANLNEFVIDRARMGHAPVMRMVVEEIHKSHILHLTFS